MSLSQWITSILQPQRPTSCHLHLLNDSQPLHTLQPQNPEELAVPRPISEPSLDLLFHQSISEMGGQEKILLVGEAGYSPGNNDRNREMLGELLFALFGTPQKYLEAHEGSTNTQSCVTSKSLSKSRVLHYPVILAVFRDTLLKDNKTLVKEVLRDVQVRTRESSSAVVGIVLTRQTCKEDVDTRPKEQLAQLMGQVFKGQSWGICCYSSLHPNSIQELKWTIIKTLGGTFKGDNAYTECQNYDLAGSFRDLVWRLGGKEKFLLLGNICPSASPSEKVGVFKELTQALFDDTENSCTMINQKSSLRFGREFMSSNECLQLPTPRSFPYPLILVVFRSSFLKEDSNKAQVKEILVDIKMRVKTSSTLVVGVLCSPEPLGEPEQTELQVLLQKILCQVFGLSTAVCSFVRNRPETVEQVKRCVCRVLKQTT